MLITRVVLVRFLHCKVTLFPLLALPYTLEGSPMHSTHFWSALPSLEYLLHRRFVSSLLIYFIYLFIYLVTLDLHCGAMTKFWHVDLSSLTRD